MADFEVLALDPTTPRIRAPGASDTYTFPRAATFPLGLANGLAYLNASKVLTTSSSLTYDGTNLLVGTANTGADGLGVGNLLNLTFPEGSGASYANLFRQTSSAATVIANGYKRSATASGFASSTGSSWAKTAIGLGVTTGAISFYADASAAATNGTDVTPTERVQVKPTGQVRFVPLASAPGGAQAGDVYYDSGTNKLRCYNGTVWNDLF